MTRIKEGDKVRDARYRGDLDLWPRGLQQALDRWTAELSRLNAAPEEFSPLSMRQAGIDLRAEGYHLIEVRRELDLMLNYPRRVAALRANQEKRVELATEGGLKGKLASRALKEAQISHPSNDDIDPKLIEWAEYLGVLSFQGLMSKPGEDPIAAPIMLFDTRTFNISHEEFVSTFSMAFDNLPYDMQDVRTAWVKALLEKVQPGENWISQLKDYFSGKTELSSLQALVDRLDLSELDELRAIRPWRKRAIATTEIIIGEDGKINFKRLEPDKFVQGDGDDIRSWPREFDQIDHDTYESIAHIKMLCTIFGLVRCSKDNIKGMRITTHLMGVTAWEDQAGDNAPEGPHQDGCDFIVSAGVVRRENIEGGESVVFRAPAGASAKDLKPEHEVCRAGIEPGQFLFQADASAYKIYGDNLWHTVTRFKVADPSKGKGIREIVGFDIEIIE